MSIGFKPYSKDELVLIQKMKEQGASWSAIVRSVNDNFSTGRTVDGLKHAFYKCMKFSPKSIKPNKVPSEKISISDLKKEYEKARVVKEDTRVYNKILVISDMHIPYHHPDAFAFLIALKKKYAFDKIVCIGDEVDYHAISFHDSNPDLPSAGDELLLSKEYLKTLYKEFPNVEVIESNHGSLVYRKALASGLPAEFFKTYNDILGAPKGWRWQFDLKLNTPIGPVYFCHGKAGAAGKLASQYGMSCVQGHFHEKAQVHYISTPQSLMWDLHTGCLADDSSLALGYNKVNPKRPIVSVAIIIDGIPQIVPMILKKGGRWIGKV